MQQRKGKDILRVPVGKLRVIRFTSDLKRHVSDRSQVRASLRRPRRRPLETRDLETRPCDRPWWLRDYYGQRRERPSCAIGANCQCGRMDLVSQRSDEYGGKNVGWRVGGKGQEK